MRFASPLRRQQRGSVTIMIIVIIVVARRQTKADASCTARELDDIHAIANAVYDDDVAAVVELTVRVDRLGDCCSTIQRVRQACRSNGSGIGPTRGT